MPYLLGLLVVCATIACGGVHAEELTGTLKKIKETKVLTMGAPDANVPFAYLDDKQEHIGYSIDLCHKIAEALRIKLGLDKLDIHTRSVTGATRIPLIQNGSIDIDCDSATNNLKRQEQVSFAPTDFIATARLVAKKSSNIKGLSDLKGQRVVSTNGSANLEQIISLNREQNLGMTIMTSKDHAAGFLMVATDRAAAFAMDDILVAALIANSKNPSEYSITTEAMSIEPSGFILRKNDPAFKKAVDDALSAIYTSGEINAIYAKWFTSPIPPKGVNLNFPMTEQLKKAFAHPTDSGKPEDYQ
jgi:glutamate/aspartate transport system substrate-binding protein